MTLGVYIQVPFCQTKCTYCNFHTGVVSQDRYWPYAEAVCREIAGQVRHLRKLWIRFISAAAHPACSIRPLSQRFSRHFAALTTPNFSEVTLEADPETITPEKSAAWINAGFNRISLGSQSFDDQELRAAGRMHRRADIFQAAQFLRGAGFRNISMDLIAGLPHQTHETWQSSLDELIGYSTRAHFHLHAGN